jgi:hypothetical protein
MAKPTQQSTDWDFTVEREKLYLPNGKDAGLWAHVRQDNGTIVGHGTDDYGLVNNRDVVGRAKDSFARAGLNDYEEKIQVFEGGKRMRALFDFKDEILEVPKVGDQIGFRLMINNSFDRSLRISFSLGFLRLWCTNGCASLVEEFGLTAKHSAKVNVDNLITDDALNKALDAFKGQRQIFTRLADMELTQEEGLAVLENLKKPSRQGGVELAEKNREQIALKWNNPAEYDQDRNLYNLYNAATAFLTHDYEENNFENAQDLNRRILKTLSPVSKGRKKENEKQYAERIKALTIMPPAEVAKN